MATNPLYSISEQTRRYLDALNVFTEFTNALHYALTETYGAEQGEQFLLSHTEQFEAIERIVWDYMKIGITQQMGGGLAQVEI